MDLDRVKTYLLSKPNAEEDFPFGDQAAVFKINNKMFALCFSQKQSVKEGKDRVNLKCDPEQAFILRDIFDAVIPGYHMNKKHWNTVILNGSIPQGEIERMIDHSYTLVVKGLPKGQRLALEIEFGPEQLYKA